jgi:hypothetical protein
MDGNGVEPEPTSGKVRNCLDRAFAPTVRRRELLQIGVAEQ